MADKHSTYDALFITDLDGTLLTDDKRVSRKDRTSLESLRQKRVATAIATGRSLYSFNKLLSSSAFSENSPFPKVDYLIFSTGAGILEFSTGRILRSFSLSMSDVLAIADYLERLKVDYMIHAPIPDTNQFLFRKHNSHNSDFATRIALYRQYGTPLTTVSDNEISRFAGATEVLCIVDRKDGHQTASMIAKHLRRYSVIKATSPLDAASIWIEIFADGVSKSGSSHLLANLLDIPRSKICAVGNDYNDEDLLCWAGSSYIVKNAPDSLQNRFTTAPSNNDNGVAGAISHWLGKPADDTTRR